jgi:hypothetical protein
LALPGIRTVLKDRFYTLQRTDTAIGPRVLAIGYRDTADGTNNVSSYDPYFAKSEEDVIASFGEGSHLHKAFLELAAGGAPRIYLVAVDADVEDADLLSTGDGNPFDLAFDAAESALPDIIVPYGRGANVYDWDDYATPATPGGADKIGFAADNDPLGANSLAKRVADKMQVIADRSNPVFAVMGVAPFLGSNSANMTTAQRTAHLTLPNLYENDDPGNLTGQYLSVVAAELRPNGYPNEFGWANGAAHYAGQISQMIPWHAPTGLTAIGAASVRYRPNRVEQEALIEKGVVPLAVDSTNAAVWVDGRTFAINTSDYVRLSTLRIVFDVVNMIRFIGRPFIGKPASLENRNGLETAITSGLRQFHLRGALLSSDFVVTYLPRENKASIDLVLQVAFEIRNIDINVSLQF